MNEIFWKATDRERNAFFWGLTDAQAQAFCDQYLQLRDKQVVLVKQKYVENGGGTNDELNYTPESLVPLWRWARTQFTTRPRTSEELHNIMRLPDVLRERELSTKLLSDASLILVIDLAYYFAEVLIRNLDGVHWKVYRTKVRRLHDGNQPVLGGFKVPVNPRGWVRGAAQNAVHDKDSEDDLLDAYRRCSAQIGHELT